MIKPNEVAYLKTTAEGVFVLRLFAAGAGISAEVRRPIAGQNGILHATEVFTVEELETQEEQRLRFKAEREEMLKEYATPTAKVSDLPPTADTGFQPN